MSEDTTNYGKFDDLQRYFQSEKGVSSNVIKEFEETYQISKKQMASLIGVSEKTYYNLMSENKLDKSRSDRFLQVQKVFEEGRYTLMSENNFKEWLHTPQVVFNNHKPFEMLQTFSGLEAVYEELFRIKHGILA